MPNLRSLLPLPVLAVLALGGALARSSRADPAPEPVEARERALCVRVTASPVTLAGAVGQVSVEGRSPLAAWFTLEGDQLVARVVTAGDLAASHDYREFGGPISSSGWAPVERALREPAEVAEAARWQVLLAQIGLTLERGLLASGTVRRGARGVGGGAPLALRPALLQNKPMFEGQVAVEGVPWSVAHDATTGIVYGDPPAYVKAREAEARTWVGRALPEINVRDGRWLNADTPPTLAGWRGHPILVLLTNTNCELECGPNPERMSKWARVYESRGLKVVTIYRHREAWKEVAELKDLPERIKAAKTAHPVLIDVADAYIEALEPGPVGYPVAFVVGADGLVAWEGASSVAGFEAALDAALEAALSAKPAAPPPGPRSPGR